MHYIPDSRDRRLLYELDLNSRQPLSGLAKKLRLSKGAVAYRVRNLQERGVIKQFQAIVDTGKLGYTSFRLYLKLSGATPQKEQEIIDFLKRKEITMWLVSIEGEYDIGAAFLARSIGKMNALWKELLERYLNYIDERQFAILTRVRYFSRAYLAGLDQNDYEADFATEPEETDLDGTDMAILRLLARDARVPIIEIASKAGVTPKTVIARIRSLEKRGIIVGYRTVFDLDMLGYQYFKIDFRLHNLTQEKLRRFKGYILSHPNIIYEDEVLGGDDLEIEMQVASTQELNKILMGIRLNFAEIIRGYRTMLFTKEHKYAIFPSG
jgi:Lrp/AsnC family leucine-responsive transcriptional regulator